MLKHPPWIRTPQEEFTLVDLRIAGDEKTSLPNSPAAYIPGGAADPRPTPSGPEKRPPPGGRLRRYPLHAERLAKNPRRSDHRLADTGNRMRVRIPYRP